MIPTLQLGQVGRSIGQVTMGRYLPTSGLWAAYSLRKVVQGYSGPALRVRRSSDSAEQDIGFDGEELNVAGLLAFASGGAAYITAWYNQTTTAARNAAQSSTSRQPRIVSGGVYDGALIFDGTDDSLITPASSGTNTAFSVYLQGKLRAITGTQVFIEHSHNFNEAAGRNAVAFIDASMTHLGIHQASPAVYSIATYSQYPTGGVSAFVYDTTQTANGENAYFSDAVLNTPASYSHQGGGDTSGSLQNNPWYLGARGPTGSLAAQLNAGAFAVYEVAHGATLVADITSILTP